MFLNFLPEQELFLTKNTKRCETEMLYKTEYDTFVVTLKVKCKRNKTTHLVKTEGPEYFKRKYKEILISINTSI